MICLRFLVLLPLLVLTLLALSFQHGSAEPTTITPPSSASAANSQSTRPSSPPFVTAIRQLAAESRTLAAAAAAAAPALLIQRADPVAEDKTYYRIPSLVPKLDVSEMEQEGVSDSDLEDKPMLETRRKCRNTYDWQYFPNRGDGKGATIFSPMKLLTRKKCVEEVFREAGFPKDFIS